MTIKNLFVVRLISNRNTKPVSARAHGGPDKARGTGYLRTFVAASCVEADGLGSRAAIGSLSTLINICKQYQTILSINTYILLEGFFEEIYK